MRLQSNWGQLIAEAARNLTIFGFNTDIRWGDTVYHVQTEAHESECLMQTAVFVRGRCIGKYSSSYANEAEHPGFTEQAHELLKQQHRFVLSSIREGRLETLLNSAASGRAECSAPDPNAVSESVTKPLGIKIISSHIHSTASELVMHLRILCGNGAAEGARVTARLDVSGSAPAYSQTVSDCDGEAEALFAVEASNQNRDIPLGVLVQAVHNGQCATRRFTLRRTRD